MGGIGLVFAIVGAAADIGCWVVLSLLIDGVDCSCFPLVTFAFTICGAVGTLDFLTASLGTRFRFNIVSETSG